MAFQQEKARQLKQLQEHIVPQLYRAAVYILGDQQAAEAAVIWTWTEVATKFTDWSDQQMSIQTGKRLLRACTALQHKSGCYHVGFAGDAIPQLVEVLSALPFRERCLLVMAAVQNYQPAEIALILAQPVWLVSHKLQRVMGKICVQNLRICC